MISAVFLTLPEVTKNIAYRAKGCRLALNFSQSSLSERSGVSLAVIKKFETTGKISLESLLKLAMILGCLEDFAMVFKPKSLEMAITLDEILRQKQRKRGRK